jgi:hypothetical protein
MDTFIVCLTCIKYIFFDAILKMALNYNIVTLDSIFSKLSKHAFDKSICCLQVRVLLTVDLNL